MIEEFVDIKDPLLIQLGKLGNISWINQFYDLVNKLLKDLGIDHNDPRLSLSVTKDGRLPVILGQRYILRPLNNEGISCIVPSDFKLKDIDGVDYGWYFSPETTRDAKWIEVSFSVGEKLPSRLYESILTVCKAILKKTTKSGFRKHHSQLLYEFITHPDVRKDIFKVISTNGLMKNANISAYRAQQKIKSILLTWNPERWKWKDHEERVLEVHRSGTTLMRWSCGNSKNIQPGDRAYLIKVGPDKPGIIAAGQVVTAPFVGTHFADKEREALYITVAFDTLLSQKKKDPVLSLKQLKEFMPEQLWTPQASGISIKDELVHKLEKLWFDHLSQNDFDVHPFSEAVDAEKTYLEGGEYTVLQTRYERDPEARRKCLSKKGYTCTVCKLNFQKKYGEIGKEFIHVHHLSQLSVRGKATRTDPEIDLVPVCPNCHAMLHRGRKTPMSPEELIEIIIKNEQDE